MFRIFSRVLLWPVFAIAFKQNPSGVAFLETTVAKKPPISKEERLANEPNKQQGRAKAIEATKFELRDRQQIARD